MVPRPTTIRQGSSAASRILAIAIVVAAPLPFGSVDQPWPALWSGLMGLSLLSADPTNLPSHVRRALLVLCGLAAAWTLVLLVQGSDPSALGREPGWRDLGRVLFPDVALPRVAASGQSPFHALGPALLMALTFARFALLAAEPGRAEQVLRAIRLSAVAIGLVSCLLFLADPGQLLGRAKVYYVGSFTGTFVNRNTAAAFFGTACLLWACRLRDIAPGGSKRQGSLVGTVLRLTDRLNGAAMMTALATVLCLGWTAMTGSRAGFLLTAVLMFAVLAWRGGRVSRKARLTAVVVAAACLGALLLTLGGLVGARLSAYGLADSYRMEVYRLCLGLIAAHPWLGIGLGNFETVLPALRTAELGMRGQWEFAHSTPLELAVEMGLPLASATLVAWLAAAVWLLVWCTRPRSGRVSVPALAVVALGTIHALIDFSLQVPGYAIVFAAIFACGFAEAGRSEDLPIGNTSSPNAPGVASPLPPHPDF